MSLTVTESIESRAFSEATRDGVREPRAMKIFFIKGSDDPSSGAVRASAPLVGDFYSSVAVTLAALASGVVTLTAAAHGLVAGQLVSVNISNATYNGTYYVASAPTANTLTYLLAHADIASAAVTGNVGSADLYCFDRQIVPLNKLTGARGVLKMTCSYGPATRLPDNSTTEEELSLMNETVHVKEGLSQTHYPSGADEDGLAINSTDEGVQGVDILAPKGLWTISSDRQDIGSGYFAAVLATVATINSGTYKSYAAGSLLYLGLIASRRGTGVWKCKHHFGFSPNASIAIVTLADGTQTVAKAGWQYMWLKEIKKDDGSGNRVIIGIDSIHVADVYNTSDFSALQL